MNLLRTYRGDGEASIETWKTDGQMESFFTTVYVVGDLWNNTCVPPGPWFQVSNTEADARTAHAAMVDRLDAALLAWMARVSQDEGTKE